MAPPNHPTTHLRLTPPSPTPPYPCTLLMRNHRPHVHPPSQAWRACCGGWRSGVRPARQPPRPWTRQLRPSQRRTAPPAVSSRRRVAAAAAAAAAVVAAAAGVAVGAGGAARAAAAAGAATAGASVRPTTPNAPTHCYRNSAQELRRAVMAVALRRTTICARLMSYLLYKDCPAPSVVLTPPRNLACLMH